MNEEIFEISTGMNAIDEALMNDPGMCAFVCVVVVVVFVVSLLSWARSRSEKKSVDRGKILLFKIRAAHGNLVDVNVDMANHAYAVFADGTTLDTNLWCISYPDGSVEHLDTYNYDYSCRMSDSSHFEVIVRKKTPYEKGEVSVGVGVMFPTGN